MKLIDIQEEVSQESIDVNKMEEGYQQLALLSKTFQKKDFGILINKPKQTLTKDDIYHIRRVLKDILDNNIFLDAGGNAGRDGKENLRLLGHRLGHGIEALVDASLAGLFGGLALTMVVNPLTWLLAAAEGGPLAALSGAAGVSTIHQAHILRDMKDAAKLISILDSLDKINRPTVKPRSLYRRIMDKLERKSPQEIKSEISKKTRNASRKSTSDFNHLVKGLPKEIQYKDHDGAMQSITIEKLFSGL